MAKIIQNKELKQRKQNLKQLKLLVMQYVITDQNKTIHKIKKEQ